MDKVKARPVMRAGVTGAVGLTAATVLWWFYQYVFCRRLGPLSLVMSRKNHNEEFYRLRAAGGERLRREENCLRFTQYSPEGLELKGFYYPCGERPCGRIAFVVHGYHSEHLDTGGMMWDFYRSRGFDLFCCDNRASGESQGLFYSYDYYESGDALRWIDFLRDRFGDDIQIVLHGFSMGGAIALKMSDRVPPNVRFIVSDSGFTSGREVLAPRLGPLDLPLRLINRLVAGFDLTDTEVRSNLRRTVTPLLFCHGREDRTVPFPMGRELFALCPSEKDSLFVDGARHIESYYMAHDAYEAKLDAFIGRYVR